MLVDCKEGAGYIYDLSVDWITKQGGQPANTVKQKETLTQLIHLVVYHLPDKNEQLFNYILSILFSTELARKTITASTLKEILTGFVYLEVKKIDLFHQLLEVIPFTSLTSISDLKEIGLPLNPNSPNATPQGLSASANLPNPNKQQVPRFNPNAKSGDYPFPATTSQALARTMSIGGGGANDRKYASMTEQQRKFEQRKSANFDSTLRKSGAPVLPPANEIRKNLMGIYERRGSKHKRTNSMNNYYPFPTSATEQLISDLNDHMEKHLRIEKSAVHNLSNAYCNMIVCFFSISLLPSLSFPFLPFHPFPPPFSFPIPSSSFPVFHSPVRLPLCPEMTFSFNSTKTHQKSSWRGERGMRRKGWGRRREGGKDGKEGKGRKGKGEGK